MGVPTTASSSSRSRRSPLKSLISGGLAGMLAKTIVAPLDRIKIMYQVTSRPFSLLHLPSTISQIIRLEGPLALWKGNSVMMFRVFPYAGVQFMVFDSLKLYLQPLTPEKTLLAGSTAGAVSTVCTYPLDLCRARLAVVKGKSTAGDFRVMILKIMENGYGQLYRGITPTLVGMVPYAGLAFSTNEFLRGVCRKVNGKEEISTWQKLQCGGVSGLIAQSAVYPMDGVDRGFEGVKKTVWETMKTVYEEQGLRGLYKGLTLNWFKGPIAFSISFTTFDFIKMRLDEFEARQEDEKSGIERIEELEELGGGETDETIVAAPTKRMMTSKRKSSKRDKQRRKDSNR
ncbi:hypothetical protein TrVE_jg12366 [Triparma verrucosa]|uniref:Mitochondrial carrier protein n=1 Tax=Triparma verrucosa TaxID=1606542 RepID=A0A9W7KRE7_9STRA|nr:hypothetical protein TrVE_jg12366 [Triparma verrucosa]